MFLLLLLLLPLIIITIPTVTIRFQPVGSAPHLRQKRVKVSSANRFESVVSFLARKLKGMEGGGAGAGEGQGQGEGATGGVFCYVNSVFAPGLDEGVGGLWRVSFWGFLWFFVSWRGKEGGERGMKLG